MPLLYSESQDLAENELNRIKSRINKSASVQLSNINNIQNAVQPTNQSVKDMFLQTMNILNKAITTCSQIQSGSLSIENVVKLILENETELTNISNFIQYTLMVNYNYLSPNQDNDIKRKVIQLEQLLNSIQLYANNLLNGGDIANSVTVYNFISSLTNSIIIPIKPLISSYSPLKISLYTPSQENPLLGGGIRHSYTYPKPRFL